MKFVPTVFAARQFVNHGHVTVNGKRVNISSYQVKDNDVIEVRNKSKQLTVVLEAAQANDRDVPGYLELDQSALKGRYNPRAEAGGCALSGDDGAESGGRVLLALILVLLR